MTLSNFLSERYFEHVVESACGRAHVLAHCADAESNGEGQVFERALAKVDDAEIARLIRRHQQDEVRHARLFWECVERQGVGPVAAVDELKLIDRLDGALGGVLDRPIETRDDVMRMYLLLQVIEERALTQFALFEPAFRRVEARTADVIASIARDEGRHLKYCHAISRRYASSPRSMAETLSYFRRVEARVFAENSRANMDYLLEHGIVDMRALEKAFWRALMRVGGRDQRTRFWGQAPVYHPSETGALAQAA